MMSDKYFIMIPYIDGEPHTYGIVYTDNISTARHYMKQCDDTDFEIMEVDKNLVTITCYESNIKDEEDIKLSEDSMLEQMSTGPLTNNMVYVTNTSTMVDMDFSMDFMIKDILLTLISTIYNMKLMIECIKDNDQLTALLNFISKYLIRCIVSLESDIYSLTAEQKEDLGLMDSDDVLSVVDYTLLYYMMDIGWD